MHRVTRGLAAFALSAGIAAAVLPPVSASAAVAPARITAYNWAVSQRGKPYIWGGTGPGGYDCSGLVYAAYRRAGIILPRTTYEMLAALWTGKLIWERSARRGDLAFWPGGGHVELYTGGAYTFGAQTSGTAVGWHRWSIWWHPVEFLRVRGAG
jgi:peptidoglycan DL-endopeptidase CwlO